MTAKVWLLLRQPQGGPASMWCVDVHEAGTLERWVTDLHWQGELTMIRFEVSDDHAETLRMALIRALVASEQYARRCPAGPRREGYQAQLDSIYRLITALNPQLPPGLDDLAPHLARSRPRRLPRLH